MTTTMTTSLPESACLGCGTLLDTATSLFEDAIPNDGDVTICIKCGHIMVFENNRPRNPTDVEMKDIAGNPRILAVQKARGKISR
jgi:hypothetical protein